jgi:hypothetical protein
VSGRIRTLKPEWLEDEKLGACSPESRLLSVSLILLADDYGNGRAAPLYLAGRVFCYSGDAESGLRAIREGLAELAGIGFVRLYEVAGQHYYNIANWDRHQRVDKPGKPRVPGTENAVVPRASADSRTVRESVANQSRPVPAPFAPDPDPDPDQDLRPRPSHAHTREGPGPEPNRTDPDSLDGPQVHRAYLDGWPLRTRPSARQGAWDPVWEHLAAWCDSQAVSEGVGPPEVLARLLGAFWADDWCREGGYKPGALRSESTRLYAAVVEADPPEDDLARLARESVEATQRGDYAAADRLEREADALAAERRRRAS